MEDNRPNQDLTNQDIEFIKEKVKERPLNRRKLFKRTLLTASMAAIFGLIACVTFLVLEPVFSNLPGGGAAAGGAEGRKYRG